MLCLSELLSDLLSREGIILRRLPMSAGVRGSRNLPLALPLLWLLPPVSHLPRSDQLAALCPALDSHYPPRERHDRAADVNLTFRPLRSTVYLIRPTSLVIRTMVEHTSATETLCFANVSIEWSDSLPLTRPLRVWAAAKF